MPSLSESRLSCLAICGVTGSRLRPSLPLWFCGPGASSSPVGRGPRAFSVSNSSRVTSNGTSLPSRSTVSLIVVPGAVPATLFRSTLLSSIFSPLMARIKSFRFTPPLSAALPLRTLLTMTPLRCSSSSDLASSSVTFWIFTPSMPRRTLPSFKSCSMTDLAMFEGIENAMPMFPPPTPPERICELMPINSPLRLTNAPPELPRLIGASVCRKSSNDPSLRPVRRPFAEIMPDVTDCPMPSGLPIARTMSPTRTVSELPSVRNGRFAASIFKTARSLGWSEPTILASNVLLSLVMTVIFSAPSTT